MGELDNISENAFVAPDVSNENSAFSENNLNQDIIAALQDDLVTSTTVRAVTSSKFIPQPEIGKSCFLVPGEGTKMEGGGPEDAAF